MARLPLGESCPQPARGDMYGMLVLPEDGTSQRHSKLAVASGPHNSILRKYEVQGKCLPLNLPLPGSQLPVT